LVNFAFAKNHCANNTELRLARLAEAKEHRTQQLFGSGAESRFLAKLKGLLPNFRP
jgi:hypothetical protein